ncbi:ArsC/Spx/MgsR family protein [Leptolyngbya sp. KIOST-1]|uniref:ArsC/Spx/MgsR family protein n=1 Tax=Leptolyngbya sp. KIOST-1 TaxID=1229172 RepID=UPI0005617113|nr:ArsC/Spx/MgsR family protein [Leptolyngbya sp. KIOST-1]
MATITFYEKPGCINNTRQKRLLEAAGHRVNAHNLLLEPWTCDRLRPFFAGLPVPQWFNTTAPAITTGLVVPTQLDAEMALELMVLDPWLIRRPLLEVEGDCRVGFDPDAIDRWIGLTDAPPTPDLETCPRLTTLRRG